MKTYKGFIYKLEPNQVFVFGSNPEGRHGGGAALFANEKYGAVYNIGRGLYGQSYALVTKNLTPGYYEKETDITYNDSGFRSVSQDQIIDNIKELYSVARVRLNKEFLVAYTTMPNLNGYSPQEMADMFNSHPIPDNMVFNEDFANLMK